MLPAQAAAQPCRHQPIPPGRLPVLPAGAPPRHPSGVVASIYNNVEGLPQLLDPLPPVIALDDASCQIASASSYLALLVPAGAAPGSSSSGASCQGGSDVQYSRLRTLWQLCRWLQRHVL